MGKRLRGWWAAHKPTRRRLIQAYAALLYNAHARGFLQGDIYTGPLKALCVPGLNCYSCPGAAAACPLGALQNALAASGHRGPWYVLGLLLLFGVMLGRTVCGWLCPMGMLQELLHKIPAPKLKKSRVTRGLSYLKYAVLAVFVVALPLRFAADSLPLPAFCKFICPAGTLEGALGLLAHPSNRDMLPMLGGVFIRKAAILVLLTAACVFVYRAFCRFLCPLGAIYGLFNRIALTGIRLNPEACTGCGQCIRQCAAHCPAGALSLRCGKIVLGPPSAPEAKKPRVSRRALLCAGALAVLLGVGIAVNRYPPENAPRAEAAQAETGTAVGMRCPDFTAALYGGGEFSPAAARGKPTIINFWATWCGPCISELPEFQRLYDAYGGRINLVAIHSALVTEDVSAYLRAAGYTFPFAQDDADESALKALGGSAVLPVTVVLDAEGVIRYHQPGAVSYETLEALIGE